MAAQRHVCRRVSDEKKNAYLGWISALKDDGSLFPDFTTLRHSGFINEIAHRLYSSGGSKSSRSDSDVLATVLYDYYGKEFCNQYIVDAVTSGVSSDGCSCELEWMTAIVVTLLLNRALTDPHDETYVLKCQKLPETAQQEIYKAFTFLATETGDRPPPTEKDWKSFLSSPVKERFDTPVTTRRSIKPQKLVATTDLIPFDLSSTPPPTGFSSRRSSVENGPSGNVSFRSPVVEGRASPLVRSTAKLREKAVEIQRLKRELNESLHQRDLQSMELMEISAKIRAAETELESLRRSDKELRTLVWELQVREEKLTEQVAKAGAMEKEIQRLGSELAAATVDKTLFDGIQKERVHVYAELASVTNERDALERALKSAEASVQRTTENFLKATAAHKEEIGQLIDKNRHLSLEIRKFQDLVDEAHWRGEEIIKLNNEVDSLKTRMADATKALEKERLDYTSHIKTLEAEVTCLREAAQKMVTEITSLKDQTTLLERENTVFQLEQEKVVSRTHFLETQVSHLQEDKQKLIEDGEVIRKEKILLESRVMCLDQEKSTIQLERDAFASRIELLELQLQDGKNKLLETGDNLRKENSSLEARVMQLEKENSSLRLERENLISRIQNLESRVLHLQDEKKKLSEHNTALRTDIESLELQLQDDKNKLLEVGDSLRKEKSSLETRLMRLDQENSSLHLDREDLISRIQDLESRVSHLQEEKKKSTEHSATLQSDIDSLEERARRHEKEKARIQTERDELLSKVDQMESQIMGLRSEGRKRAAEYEHEMHLLENKSKEDKALLQSKISLLENQVSTLTHQRDSLSVALEARRQNACRLAPTKRARQDSSRSGTSVGTSYGGTSSAMSAERHNTRFDNCEDEDDVMLQTTVEPGDGPAVRDAYVPAARGDNGITPGRKRLSGHSMGATEEEFKVPALPREPLVRSLQFHNQHREEQEESWSDGASFLEKLEQNGPRTPWDKRLSTLHLRNQQLPPHLKSSYPVEIQALPADSVKDDELKNSSAFEPPSNLQAMKSNGSSPVAEAATRKKTGAPKESPAGKFLSRFAKRGNHESKIPKIVKEEEESQPKSPRASTAFEITITPKDKKKTAPSKWALKKKSGDNSTTLNVKPRFKKN